MSQKSMKTPSKIGRPGAVRPGSMTPSSSKAQSALEKSARAAGLNARVAESYASEMMHHIPGFNSARSKATSCPVFASEHKLPLKNSAKRSVSEDRSLNLKRSTLSVWERLSAPALNQSRRRLANNAPQLWKKRTKNRGAKDGPELETSSAPGDDYKIGDFVYVGGTKPGRIAFIGEAQFAAGEWAGVVLESPVGKNDGSVAGVRYFQCEPKRGVFSRLAKLSKIPVEGGIKSDSTAPPPAASKPRTPTEAPAAKVPATPKTSGLLKRGSISGSHTNLSRASPHSSTQNLSLPPPSSSSSSSSHLRVGERVVVNGTKVGVLRYIGVTEFAKGEWAGIELDDPLGKNDGAVAGKRYFECRPLYGLFSPIHKVQKQQQQHQQQVPVTSARRPSLKFGQLNRERSGSQDSVSSIGSSASSVSRSRVRLGVTSLGPTQLQSRRSIQPGSSKTPSRSTTLTATTSALQKALKEKEEHIDQLLQEHDLERSEFARASLQVDEAEKALDAMERKLAQSEEGNQILKSRVEALESDLSKVEHQWEEEKRKNEDLQFSIEEVAIDKTDIENKYEADSQKVNEMKTKMEIEEKRANKLQEQLKQVNMQLAEYKGMQKAEDESSEYYLSRIEELTNKLSQAEGKAQEAEAKYSAEIEKNSVHVDGLRKESMRVTELENSITDYKRQIKSHEESIQDFEDQLDSERKKFKKIIAENEELNEKLSSSHESSANYSNEITSLKEAVADLQRLLNASSEKYAQLNEDKMRLEMQISDMVNNSGDSSEQLSTLNEQLMSKDRQLQEVQGTLSEANMQISKLTERVEIENEKKVKEIENLKEKHEQEISDLQGQIKDAQSETEKATFKLTKLKEAFEAEQKDVINSKAKEISEMKSQIARKDEEERNLKHRLNLKEQEVEQIQSQMADAQREKTESDKAIAQLEIEKQQLTSEVAKVIAQKEALAADQNTIQSQHGDWQQKLLALEVKRDDALSAKAKLEKETEELKGKIAELDSELSKVREESRRQQEELRSLEIGSEEAKNKIQQQEADMLSQTADLEKALEDCVQAEVKLKEMTTESESIRLRLAEVEAKLKDKDKEITAVHSQLQTATAAKEKLQLDLDALQLQYNESKARDSKRREEHSVEKSSLQNTLDTTRILLQQKEKEVDRLTNELSSVQNEAAVLRSQSANMTSLELEKHSLEEKLEEMEFALAETQVNMNDNHSAGETKIVELLKSEKETIEAQNSFLNTVIVDQQHKLEEMQARLEVMETGNSSLISGSNDISLELSPQPGRRVPAPRLFCDICDVFDLHETDDCPTQAMEASPPASNHNGKRHESRPYCEICESFGHDTQECDDEQTF